MGERFLAYAGAIRTIVNPGSSSPFVVAAGANGADISTLYCATHFTRAYFLDKIPVSRSRLIHSVRQWAPPKTKGRYFQQRLTSGYCDASSFDQKLEFFLAQELRAMGVEKQGVNRRDDLAASAASMSALDCKGRPVLTFRMPGEKQRREIVFVEADLEELGRALRNELEGGLDLYWEKAAFDLPRHYDRYIMKVADWVKPGGFMVMNNFAMDIQSALEPGQNDWLAAKTGNAVPLAPFLAGSFQDRTREVRDVPQGIRLPYGVVMSVWQRRLRCESTIRTRLRHMIMRLF